MRSWWPVEPLKWSKMRKLCVVFFALWLCLFAGADPFSGAWTLNLSKSTLPPPHPRSQVVHIKANQKAIQIRQQIVNENGHVISVTVKAKFDGKDHLLSARRSQIRSHTRESTSAP